MNFNNDFNGDFDIFDETILNCLSSLTKNLMGQPTIIEKTFSPANYLKTYLSIATNLNEKSIDVLMYILEKSNADGLYVGTYDTIINDLQISRNTLANIMTELQSKNLITKVKDGWQVSSSVNIPINGQNIVIQFSNETNRNPKTSTTEKTKPEFDFKQFCVFITEYIKSYNRLSSDDNQLNSDSFIKEISLLEEEYTNSDTTLPVYKFAELINEDKYLNKKELIKSLNKYMSTNNKKKYYADPDAISICDVRTNYLELFKTVADISKDTEVLVKSALIQILDIADILGLHDFKTIKALITNQNNIGVKLAVRAEAIINNRRINDNRVTSIKYYLQRYTSSMAFEYLNAIFVLIEDEYTIVNH